MYKDEQKAILLTKDTTLKETLEPYLYQRYNLRMESTEDILEIFTKLAADDTPEMYWNLAIIDETAAGLQTTAQSLKTLKAKYNDINVVYLSNILEITEPYRKKEMKIPPEYADEDYRLDQMDEQMDNVLGLMVPITKCKCLAEVYDAIPKSMVENYGVDWALCSVLRLDEKPLKRGVATSDHPEILDIPYLFPIKGTGYLEEMLFNFKPIHIPDLDKDIPFRDELEAKFFRRYRSSLLLPMQYDGHYIGFLGFFTRTRPRLYNLAELDILQRFADMCTAAIIAHFYKEHGDLDLDDIKRRMEKETLGDTMNNV